MNNRERNYVVHLTNDQVIKPDICKVTDSGWLYCCWTDESPGISQGESEQRKYPPQQIKYYENLPTENADD